MPNVRLDSVNFYVDISFPDISITDKYNQRWKSLCKNKKYFEKIILEIFESFKLNRNELLNIGIEHGCVHLVKKFYGESLSINILISEAAEVGQLEVLRFLNSVNVGDKQGHNWGLVWASSNGHFEVVKYLVEQGADVNFKEQEALKKATLYSRKDIVKYLKKVIAERKM